MEVDPATIKPEHLGRVPGPKKKAAPAPAAAQAAKSAAEPAAPAAPWNQLPQPHAILRQLKAGNTAKTH